MNRLLYVAVLLFVCGCVANEPLVSYQTNYKKVNVDGVEVVPATQTSQLWVGMPENDVYKVLGSPSGQMDAFLLFFDLYDPKFSGRTIPYYVLLDKNGNVRHWGSSGSPDKPIDIRALGY